MLKVAYRILKTKRALVVLIMPIVMFCMLTLLLLLHDMIFGDAISLELMHESKIQFLYMLIMDGIYALPWLYAFYLLSALLVILLTSRYRFPEVLVWMLVFGLLGLVLSLWLASGGVYSMMFIYMLTGLITGMLSAWLFNNKERV